MEEKDKFAKYARKGTCEVCGKETDVVVVASSLGPVSNAICRDCFDKELEPVGNIAGYLTSCGINSYERLCESGNLKVFIEAQMQARNASDEDWNNLWEVVNYSIDAINRLDNEDDGIV